MKLENLFKWEDSFEVMNRDGTPVKVDGEPLRLYQRVVGDAELSVARKNALYASREIRQELKDEASRDRAALLPEYEDMTNDELKNAIVLTEAYQLHRRAESLADLPKYPVKPKDDSLEAQEEYQVVKDTYAKRKQEAIDKKLQELINNRKEELKGVRKETLQEQFLDAVVKTMARSKMLEIFNSWCAYLGTYEDKEMTQRAFESYESFDNAATELKQQIIRNYLRLEFSSGELKKSPLATNSEESGSSRES